MTEEELIAACIKFTQYLQANGHTVHAHIIMVDDDLVIGRGDKTKAQMMITAAVADMLNCKLVPK